ncbi:hypothetical protein E1A91_A03G148200v1 [Gossypium mustelinum]|uniref:Uncharacterized protein n=1 Tax=Gossypium mustelinum TaxID=34275 RepID=A0A5D2ZZQ5_GOSMU|nr:hypothetical protein E1A91_A03G148200v1 [Gossypium mustelinum]
MIPTIQGSGTPRVNGAVGGRFGARGARGAAPRALDTRTTHMGRGMSDPRNVKPRDEVLTWR